MANLSFDQYRIVAMATSVPTPVRTSQDFAAQYGQDVVDKIIKNVGVVQGHLSDAHTTTSDLCLHAANTLLDGMAIARDSIDVLLFVSQAVN